ncbi:glycerophosphoryl diester phosphodiesterase membrane domain-containing protein [Arcanobacterium ihumii]|uniref:glycerophosphoryl diester phosphodiesterase membrane domain-containing protein n=1 Tax=Arcanobacterium ihumii TaxID=2138162 RepID=UPI000F539D5D|nr:glycerophosphoryl diester phosphodiesterase membrane domain-containing protein [Arcanobacterium ihumii]
MEDHTHDEHSSEPPKQPWAPQSSSDSQSSQPQSPFSNSGPTNAGFGQSDQIPQRNQYNQYGQGQYATNAQGSSNNQYVPNNQYGSPQADTYRQPEDYSQPAAYGYEQKGQYGVADPRATQFSSGWRTVIPLHPLGVGETLDAVLRLIKFNPVAFIAFPVIVGLIFSVVSSGFIAIFGESTFLSSLQDPTSFSAEASIELVGSYAFMTTLILAFFSLLQTSIITIAGARVTLASVRGKKLPLSETFKLVAYKFWNNFFKLIATTILLGLVYFAAFFVVGLIVVSIIAATAPSGPDDVSGGTIALIFLLFFLLMLLFLAFSIRVMLAPTAVVIEGAGPIEAIKRSWNLTRGSFFHILGLIVLTIFFGIAVGIIFMIIFAIVGGITASTGSSGAQIATLISFSLSMLIGSALIVPFTTALTNMVYINMRFRRENFHQQLLMEATGR